MQNKETFTVKLQCQCISRLPVRIWTVKIP